MRRTFLTSALDMPEIMSYIYSKSWKLQFSASSSIIIIEDYYLQTFLHSLNSASERAIRTFCLGKKNWMFHNTAKGASASAMVYSISETAKLNNLRPYYYFKYILTELPKLCEEKENIDPEKLDYLMPWSDSLPDECRKPRLQ